MVEYKDFIREVLLDRTYGSYRLIVDMYPEQMEFLKMPSLFRLWLSDELKLPVEKINLNSLKSALKRQRKKKIQQLKLRSTKQGQQRICQSLIIRSIRDN